MTCVCKLLKLSSLAAGIGTRITKSDKTNGGVPRWGSGAIDNTFWPTWCTEVGHKCLNNQACTHIIGSGYIFGHLSVSSPSVLSEWWSFSCFAQFAHTLLCHLHLQAGLIAHNCTPACAIAPTTLDGSINTKIQTSRFISITFTLRHQSLSCSFYTKAPSSRFVLPSHPLHYINLSLISKLHQQQERGRQIQQTNQSQLSTQKAKNTEAEDVPGML